MAEGTGFTNNGSGSIASSIANLPQTVLNNTLGQVAGIISTKPTAKYTSGARTTLKINGALAAFAFSISWKITTDVAEIRTIDNYLPYELVPNMIHVEGTLGGWHVPGQSSVTTLIQPDVLSFLFNKYITIEVRDSATDQVIFLTNKAWITSKTEDLTAKQIGRVQLTWKAIGWQDELPAQAPPDIDTPGAPYANATRQTPPANPIANITQGVLAPISGVSGNLGSTGGLLS